MANKAHKVKQFADFQGQVFTASGINGRADFFVVRDLLWCGRTSYAVKGHQKWVYDYRLYPRETAHCSYKALPLPGKAEKKPRASIHQLAQKDHKK